MADVACAPPVFDVTVVSRRRQPVELELVVSNESEADGPPEVWRGLAHGSRVQVGPVGFGRRVRVSVREGGVASRVVVVQVMTLGGELFDLRRDCGRGQKRTPCCGLYSSGRSEGSTCCCGAEWSCAGSTLWWVPRGWIKVLAGVARPSVAVSGGSGVDGTGPADGWVEAVTSVPDGEVTRTDVWVADGDADGEDLASREPGADDVVVRGDETRRVQVAGVSAGRLYGVRVRVWRGPLVSDWSRRVVVRGLSSCAAAACCGCGCGYGRAVVGRACGDRHGGVAAVAECVCCGR